MNVRRVFLSSVIFAGLASGQVTLTLDPAVITSCAPSGAGRTRVVWSRAGVDPVIVHVLSATGPALTGPMPADGQAETGDWVADGMLFVLTDSSSRELAHVTARLRCIPVASLNASLAAGPYLPLSVGNSWVYRVKSRTGGPYYAIQRVERAQLDAAGNLWFVIVERVGETTSEGAWRVDEQGRIHRI